MPGQYKKGEKPQGGWDNGSTVAGLLGICLECPDLFGMQQCVSCKLPLIGACRLASLWLQPRESMRTNLRAGQRETPGCPTSSGSEWGRVSNSDHLSVCGCWTAPPRPQLQQTIQSSGAGSIPVPIRVHENVKLLLLSGIGIRALPAPL